MTKFPDVEVGAHGEGAPTSATCSIEDCDSTVKARGWCSAHYQRWARTGDPEGTSSQPRYDAWTHGSRRGYDCGCRCFKCRVVNNRYIEAWRRGQKARIPASEVAAHLQELIDSGWTQVGIAEAAGVGRTTPWHILAGRNENVNSRTAAALLSLEPLREVVLDAWPLIDAIENRGITIVSLGDADRRAFYRARLSGRISEALADRIAIRHLGLTLVELYGHDYDQEVAA